MVKLFKKKIPTFLGKKKKPAKSKAKKTTKKKPKTLKKSKKTTKKKTTPKKKISKKKTVRKKPKKAVKKKKITRKKPAKKKTTKKKVATKKITRKAKKPIKKKVTRKKIVKKKITKKKVAKKSVKKPKAKKVEKKPIKFRPQLKGKTASVIIKEMGVDLDDQTATIADMLEKKEEISENELALKLKVKINAVRRSLYKLHDLGLATYAKQKDAVKKWWYLYSWTLDVEKLYHNYLKFKKEELEKKRDELSSEQHYAFQCKKCKKKYSYEEGLEQDFNCEDCEKVLVQVANKKLMKQLEDEIAEMEIEFKKAKGEE